MPIYEYACGKCGHRLDELQKITDAPLVKCPACGKAALQRLVSAPRFRLKGQGWYETDFKKDKQRNIAGEAEAKKDKPDDKVEKKDKPQETDSKKSTA